MSSPLLPTEPEAQVASFIAKFSPLMQARLREARAAMQALVPRGFELVYDNYNALVFGYSPTKRTKAAVMSIAGYPQWVRLFFFRGAELPDPHGLLEGQGSSVRSIRLPEHGPPLADKRLQPLIAAALAHDAAEWAAAPPRRLLVKSVADEQRPRRPPDSL
jgi:hypothetical protein